MSSIKKAIEKIQFATYVKIEKQTEESLRIQRAGEDLFNFLSSTEGAEMIEFLKLLPDSLITICVMTIGRESWSPEIFCVSYTSGFIDYERSHGSINYTWPDQIYKGWKKNPLSEITLEQTIETANRFYKASIWKKDPSFRKEDVEVEDFLKLFKESVEQKANYAVSNPEILKNRV